MPFSIPFGIMSNVTISSDPIGFVYSQFYFFSFLNKFLWFNVKNFNLVVAFFNELLISLLLLFCRFVDWPMRFHIRKYTFCCEKFYSSQNQMFKQSEELRRNYPFFYISWFWEYGFFFHFFCLIYEERVA